MPKVIVYVRADDARRLERGGRDPAAFVRSVAKVAIAGFGEAEEPRLADVTHLGPPLEVDDAPPEPEEPRERCSVFHPRLRPLRQCRLLDGHAGNHEF